MAPKRKRLPDAQVDRPVTENTKSRPRKRVAKSQRAKTAPEPIKKGNFDALTKDRRHSEAEAFDYNGSRGSDIILVDSDNEENELDVVVISDSEEKAADKADDAEDEPVAKKQKIDTTTTATTEQDIAKNLDFIGFGVISSDEEDVDSNAGGDDDGYVSVDENGIVYRKASTQSTFPWVKDHDHSTQKEVADWLTMEMKDFVGYISPSSHEIHERNKVVNRLKKLIKSFWPETEAHVFGSCATDLYLPGSDIDMVIVSSSGDYEERSRLYQLSSYLRSQQLAKNMEVIAKAKVPIIKFIDPQTGIHIDISFEKTNGIIAAKKIRKWLEDTPGLRELVLIVKQFLRSRKLNNVHVGGLGGYATIILCYHFLKLHPRIATDTMSTLDNLGSLLIEFFELYGRNFAYDDLIIALDAETDAPKYLKKAFHSALNTSRNSFAIVIQDPSDPFNNITRSSFNLRDLKKAFNGAFQMLTEKCYDLSAATYKNRLGALILGDIIKYQGKERDFNDDRHKVVNHALVNHNDHLNDDDESDGHDGNDKYYLSDMTNESDSDELHDAKSQQLAAESKATKKKVSGYLGLDRDDDDDDEDEDSQEESEGGHNDTKEKQSVSRNSNLDKETRRDYWSQKGLVIS